MTTKQELLDTFLAQDHVIGIQEPQLSKSFEMTDGRKYERYAVTAIAVTQDGLRTEDSGMFSVVIQQGIEEAGWMQIPAEQKYKATEKIVIDYLTQNYPDAAFFELTASSLPHGYAKVTVYVIEGDSLIGSNIAVYSDGAGGLSHQKLV